jgi:tripeptide aminopeptidase
MMDIQRWRDHPAVQQACNRLANIQPILETAIAVQQIPAPTFDEFERSTFVQAYLADCGLQEVSVDAIGNVYGRRPGRTPGVLVSAHLDTVFPRETDLGLRYEDDRIYGPGLGDNSTGVASMLHLARILQTMTLPDQRELWFVGNVSEEGLGDLRGMRTVMNRLRERIEAVIVIEGCDFGTLHHQAIGVRRYRISVEAPGGHSWGNFGSPSAIHTLVQLASRITALDVSQHPRTTFNIGVIEGGTSVNTIAQDAHMLLDLRSVSAPRLAEVIRQVDDLVADTGRRHPDVRVRVETVGDRPSGSIPRQHPLVQAAVDAYRTMGATVSFQQSSTDANIPLSLGIPAVCVGITDGGNPHRSDEYILPERLGAGLQALLLLTLAASS